MKTVVVFYSLTGNNSRLANFLKEKLKCECFEIKTKKKIGFCTIFNGIFFKKDPKLEEYRLDMKSFDKIIFLSPVWFGKLAFAFKSFLKIEKQNIKKYSFLSICLGDQKNKIEKELISHLGTNPNFIEIFSLQKLKNSNKPTLSDKLNDEIFEKIKNEIDIIIDKI